LPSSESRRRASCAVTVGPLYAGKTIDLCVDNDLVCDPHGSSFSVHNQYAETGTVDQGVTYVAAQLQAIWAAEVLAAQPQTALSPQAPAASPAEDTAPSQHLPSAPLTPPGPVAVTPPLPAAPLT